ncbi:CLUMA_CG012268, isoform A [Clunio marinus]|uniref:CLUMA_CG012268, isoform A n=1 Tax=Clunio marinus TaxID=568069 RepID=A0A1J1IEQ5_9DIPT|nr:CLUMA_CG012268, isoform A [Clunio marinus]
MKNDFKAKLLCNAEKNEKAKTVRRPPEVSSSLRPRIKTDSESEVNDEHERNEPDYSEGRFVICFEMLQGIEMKLEMNKRMEILPLKVKHFHKIRFKEE